MSMGGTLRSVPQDWARGIEQEAGAWTPAEVRAWVERHGGNVTACARRLDMSRQHLQDILAGKRPLSRILRAHMETLDRYEASAG